MTDVDDAVAKFRRRLQGEAKLAESDLDELEEHLRELTDELCSMGMSAAAAVTEAARRLGDPRQLAREHVRVRSPLGVPLSTGRALSAAAIFMVQLIAAILNVAAASGPPVGWRIWLEFGAFFVIGVALATRRSWARVVVLAVTLRGLTLGVAVALLLPLPTNPLLWIGTIGVLAFVMPWRRKEITLPAITLVLHVWAGASVSSLPFWFMEEYGGIAIIAMVCAVVACVGTALRARWRVIASAISALALFSTMGALSLWMSEVSDAWQLLLFVSVGSGAIAASAATILDWRAPRSLARNSKHVTR